MSTDTIVRAPSWREVLKVALAIAALAVGVAAPSLLNGFVYDDVWLIEQNGVVQQLDVPRLLTSPFWPEERGAAMWRPIALIAYALQWSAGGGSPLPFHLINILLYGLSAGVFALLAGRLLGPQTGLIAGILFAVHPVHVEVFANVTGQTELVAALGYVAALWLAWERSFHIGVRRRTGLLIGIAVFLSLALGAKEHAVTFPAALFVVWWLRRRRTGEPLREIVSRERVTLLTSVLLVAAYLVFRAHFGRSLTWAGGVATGLEGSIASRAIVMLPASLQWLKLLFAPIELSADYSPQHVVPQHSLGVEHLVALGAWLSLGAVVWLRRREWPGVFVGSALFLVSISVVSNILVPMEVLLAERLLFLPSAGWALGVSAVLVLLFQGMQQRRQRVVLWTLIVAVGAALAGRSLSRGRVWRNNDVFFAKLLEDAPLSFRSHWAAGARAFERGDSVLGEREMRVAIRLNPEYPPLLEDLGRRYASSNRYEAAIPLLEGSLARDSARTATALPLSLALARVGRISDAMVVLSAMERLHGRTRGLAIVWGEVLMRAGEFDRALGVLVELIAREPREWSVRTMAAEAAAMAGACSVAYAQADTALQQAPPSARPGIEQLRNQVIEERSGCTKESGAS